MVLTGKERLEGCLQFLKEKEISLPDQYLKIGRHSIEHGYQSMKELLSLKDIPTAVFLGNFEIILGAVMALNESDYQCPSDISVIGFDDLIISNLSNPRLTLVVQPLRELADSAADLLLKRADQGKMSGKETDRSRKYEEIILPALISEGNSIARRTVN